MGDPFQPTRLPGYSKEEVLAEIGRVANSEFAGRAPKPIEFDNSSARVSRGTVLSLFDTWAEAMRQAGLAYEDNTVSNAEIVADLRKTLAANNGACFTRTFYKKAGGRCHPDTIKIRFGCNSWAELLQRVVGVSPIPRKIKTISTRTPKVPRAAPSELQLFSEIGRVWHFLGRQPTRNEFEELGRISTRAYNRAFGTWPSAILRFCEIAGYQPSSNYRRPASPAEILADIKKVLTHNPKATLLHKTYLDSGGLYSLKTIRHHFKGWIQALHHLGISQHRAEQRFSDEEIFREIQKAWESLGRQPKYCEMKAPFSAMSAYTISCRFGGFTKAIHAFCADRQRIDDVDTEFSSFPEEQLDAASAPTKQPDKEIDAETPVVTTATKRKTPRTPGWRLRFQVFVRDILTCQNCGKSRATHPKLILEPDHIIPYSKGGETVLENLQLLCHECNGGKSDSMPPNVGG